MHLPEDDPSRIIKALQQKEISNYLESTERLFLDTVIKNKQLRSKNKITEREAQELIRLFKKYKRFIKS